MTDTTPLTADRDADFSDGVDWAADTIRNQ